MRSSTCIGIALVVAGCQTAVAVPSVRALVVDPTDAGRAELQQAVASALGGRPVLLAADALTHSSDLLIERTPRAGPEGIRIPGRDTEPVQRFRLLVYGGKCLLVHVNTDTRFELGGINCQPADAKSVDDSNARDRQ